MADAGDRSGVIVALESIRGLAALCVVFLHLPGWVPAFHAIPFVRNGAYMVDLFFVLSGFVIARAYADRLNSGRDMLRFQLLRTGRLYPLHLVMLIAFVAIEALRAVLAARGGALVGAAPFSENNATALLLQLGLAQSLGPERYWNTFNAPAWSISVEYWGYLVFALLCWLVPRGRRAAFALAALVGAFALIEPGVLPGVNAAIARMLAGFFTGALVATVVRPAAHSVAPIVLPLTTALLVGIVTLAVPSEWARIGVILASAALIIAAVGSRDGTALRTLQRSWLVRLGAWSYALYMVHVFVIYCVAQVVMRLDPFPRADVGGISVAQPGTLIGAAMIVGTVGLALVLAAILHRMVEAPLRAATRRFVARNL